MTRGDFIQLRDLPDKRIREDILFLEGPDSRPNRVFSNVQIENSLGVDVRLNGTYKPGVPALSLNVTVRGVGPICRLEVNGTVHGPAGRTHKHDLRTERCPRRNLPHAEPREDLTELSPAEVWEVLCREANIVHLGRFVDPEGGGS
jgi:hypothetical protein